MLVGAIVGVLLSWTSLGVGAASAGTMLPDGGYPSDALSLSTVTDTLPGLGALSYAARPGDVVVRTYKLTNRSEATIVHVGIDDPEVGGAGTEGGLGDCGPSGRGTLVVAAWSSVTCTVQFTAVAGMHRAHVTASGCVCGTDMSASASADAGYYAATPGLSLRVSFGRGERAAGVPVSTKLHLVYVISNGGDIGLANVSVSDGHPVSGLNCGAGTPDIGVLAPGALHVCTGELRAAVGVHTGVARVSGVEVLGSISAGGPGAPLGVTAVADSTYTGVRVPGTKPKPTHVPSPSPPSGVVTTVSTPGGRQVSAPGGHHRSAPSQGGVRQIAPLQQLAVNQAAPSQVHGQTLGSAGGSTSGHGLPALIRRHHHAALGLLLMVLIVVLVPTVRLLLRRTAR